MVVPILIIVVLAVVAGLVYIGLRDDKGGDPIQDRLAQFAERELPDSLEEIELSLPFRDRVLLPTLRKVAVITTRFTPKNQLEETRKQIELAGLAGSMDPTAFFAIGIGAPLGVGLLAFLVFFLL